LREGEEYSHGERENGIAKEREEKRCEVENARLHEMKKSAERVR